jgi:C4-dicarboxylate transporter, DctM subunit
VRAIALRLDEGISSMALSLMLLIPLVEMALRPSLGRGIDNAPVLVQHLGLVMAMLGASVAERHGHLSTLGGGLAQAHAPGWRKAAAVVAPAGAALVCGALAAASWQFVASERAAGQLLAYALPTWWVQAVMPLGFVLLGLQLGSRVATAAVARAAAAFGLPLAGAGLAVLPAVAGVPFWVAAPAIALCLAAGAPIFAALGALALILFAQDAMPLASVALSHYQITVNPSLPALPLFTLAGLVFARTGAAGRLGALLIATFGGGRAGTVLATAVLCSAFTAFTGGSGVTILALGGLLLPMLERAGYPQRRAIGLVTSASALGVLLAPSVPLIMYAVVARVPIKDMLLAGLLPAALMVACLLLVGGFLRPGPATEAPEAPAARPALPAPFGQALWAAKWEVAAPLVAIGSLAGGLATPTESAALTAAYALATQALIHRELDWRLLARTLGDCVQIIGGVMLILAMALALTNFLVDAGIPDAAIDWVRGRVPNRYVFLVCLCAFLFAAAALMEIYAAIVVLVPLLVPLARSYGIDPVHFGIIFLAAMEAGFLCPPAGMNIYFASAMFGKPVRYVAAAAGPALWAIVAGTLVIALVPSIATALPAWLGSG